MLTYVYVSFSAHNNRVLSMRHKWTDPYNAHTYTQHTRCCCGTALLTVEVEVLLLLCPSKT